MILTKWLAFPELRLFSFINNRFHRLKRWLSGYSTYLTRIRTLVGIRRIHVENQVWWHTLITLCSVMGWIQQSPWKGLGQLAQSEWPKSQAQEKPCLKQKVEMLED